MPLSVSLILSPLPLLLDIVRNFSFALIFLAISNYFLFFCNVIKTLIIAFKKTLILQLYYMDFFKFLKTFCSWFSDFLLCFELSSVPVTAVILDIKIFPLKKQCLEVNFKILMCGEMYNLRLCLTVSLFGL